MANLNYIQVTSLDIIIIAFPVTFDIIIAFQATSLVTSHFTSLDIIIIAFQATSLVTSHFTLLDIIIIASPVTLDIIIAFQATS